MPATHPYPFRTKPEAERAGDVCAATRCKSPGTIIHLGTPLCERHWLLAAAEPAAVQQ